MKPLANDAKPSTRLLQARAAKSAQKRAVELLDVEGARHALDLVKDPSLLKQRKKDMSLETQKELNYLARRLAELIPTENSLTDMDSEQSAALYKSLFYMKEQSPSVENLLRFQDQTNMKRPSSKQLSPGTIRRL